MTKRSCRTCVYWDQAGAALSSASVYPQASPDIGACCVDPPRLMQVNPYWSEGQFPLTHSTRFCAEWKPHDDPDDGEREPAPSGGNVLAFDRGVA